MIWREIGHIECVAHQVLGLRYVDDVGIVVDALEDLEGSVTSWLQLGVALGWEPLFAQVDPNQVSFLEDHCFLGFVDGVCFT
jgi:hypothetical protein